MIIDRIDSNIETFRAIKFKNGFNVIVGDSSRNKDSRAHNLGKTTAIKIIDFVLFNGSGTFLNKIKGTFPEALFTIQYEENNEKKIFERDFHRRKNGSMKEVQTQIDYEYFIRYQDEFDLDNGFRKPDYKGPDVYWKPRLIGLLGFNQQILEDKLKLNKEIDDLDNVIKTIRITKVENDFHNDEIVKLKEERDILQGDIKNIDFTNSSEYNSKIIIDEMDNRLTQLNISIFALRKEIEKIEYAMDRSREYTFNMDDVNTVFAEVGLYFNEALNKNIEELKGFYTAVYKNRYAVLASMNNEKKGEIEDLIRKRSELNTERKIVLSRIVISGTEDKYKEAYNRIIEIEKRLSLLERDIIHEDISELEDRKSKKQTQNFDLAAKLSHDIDNNQAMFIAINNVYSDIMRRVLNIEARIYIDKKSTGNIDFELKSYRDGIETEELRGDTAKRISAAAIDIAIRSIRNTDYGFIAHDGVIDDIDKNAAEQFIGVVMELSTKYKFQYILTALKDRLPRNIKKEDIVIELNDYEDKGLLFGFKY
jgi:uncharacterized protein YydD (DUF2326 family)